jgi:hypothetical protein
MVQEIGNTPSCLLNGVSPYLSQPEALASCFMPPASCLRNNYSPPDPKVYACCGRRERRPLKFQGL